MLDLTKWPMERKIMLRMGKTGGVDSKAEEIRDFDENLAAIIQEAIGNVEEVAVGILAEAGIEILQVAVVTDIYGGAGMEEVREEQIGVEVFGRLERSQILVGKDCRILTNKAKREFASDLVVPPGADDRSSCRYPANLAVQRDLLEEGRLEEETRMMVSIVAITRKGAEVDWAKAFVAEIAKEAEKYLALKLKTVVGVGKPFKTRALVVPIVDGK